MILEAKHIKKWFGEGDHKTYALKDISFELDYGEMLYIIGPSGSGKTTLLSIVSGILRPNEGVVIAEGRNIWELAEDDLAEYRSRKLGFVFQDFHLFNTLTVKENVAVPLILQKKEMDFALKEAEKRLEIVGLSERMDLRPNKLSIGEQQRVAIARAMITEPDLLIFDEPTASLDGETGKRIISFIRENILTEEKAIIVVTHDNRIYDYATRIIQVEDGKMIPRKDDQ
uniref:ABC-type export system ATP-binding subunit n=1 Tax=uncultured microorganism TaxID=358574 RepID=F8UGY1_9ZZZZ|nr:ABC-type export system ATP-binding subunit [uncultured microorganism]